MNKKKFVVVACLAAGLGAAGTQALFAHGGATGIVKERMDAMLGMGKIVKSLSEMMRGDKEYDAKQVKAGAEFIKKHAGEAMTKQFPEGVKSKHTEARPEIWKNWEEFRVIAGQLETFATALEKAADNGLMKDAQHGPGMMGGKSGSMSGSGMMMGGKPGSMMGGGSQMMGGPGMMGQGGQMPNAEMLASMPADGVFNMMTQTCSSCHTKFRIEKKKK